MSKKELLIPVTHLISDVFPVLYLGDVKLATTLEIGKLNRPKCSCAHHGCVISQTGALPNPNGWKA